MTAASESRPDRPFTHEAFLYASDDEFFERTVSFLREGIARDEPVLTVVDPAKIRTLRGALGLDSDRVTFADMAEVGRNPALIIQAWRDFIAVNRVRGAALRGIGEPIYPARSDAALDECHIHESVLNFAFGDQANLWILCPYDTTTLPQSVIDRAIGNHPHVSDPRDRHLHPSHAFDPDDWFTSPLPAPPADAESFVFGVSTLHALRRFVGEEAKRLGVAGERISPVMVAASEIATNAVVHGRGDAHAKIWRSDGFVLCEIRGSGRITDPLVGRLRPDPARTHGYGVWLANQFCDLVQIRSSEAGTTVRLHVRAN